MAVEVVTTVTDPKNDVLQYWPQLRYEHLVAGVAGGVLSTLVVHPFDLLKIRLSVNDGKEGRPLYRSLRHAAHSIWSSEGLRGLYQGVTPNCIGSGCAWGLYFVFYNATKTFMNGGDQSVHLGPAKHMQAAIQSGVLTLLCTNPIFVVKTRMCLRYEGGASGGVGNVEYGSVLRAISTIYRREGLLGFYKGLVPGLFGTTHGAVQFMIYEELKKSSTKKAVDGRVSIDLIQFESGRGHLHLSVSSGSVSHARPTPVLRRYDGRDPSNFASRGDHRILQRHLGQYSEGHTGVGSHVSSL